MTLQTEIFENSITTTELTISYNGESIDNNTIDVSDLASTLLSIRQMCMQTLVLSLR